MCRPNGRRSRPPWRYCATAAPCRCSRIRIATGCSAGALRELIAAFVQEGGVALEASMAGMSPNDADRIASLCRRFKLHASMGSDFHDPAVPWNPLGRWLKLAAGLEPVTNLS